MLLYMEIVIGMALGYGVGWIVGWFIIRPAIVERRERRRYKAAMQRRREQVDYILNHVDVVGDTCYYRD